jgi:plasmid stability protein
MATLVIDAFPEALHAQLKRTAEAHRRSISDETVHLLEAALAAEDLRAAAPKQSSYWRQRRLLPEYQALLNSGALAGGTDSTAAISAERDQR